MPAPRTVNPAILIVEDNFLTARLLSEAFNAAGHLCITARNCDDAIEKAAINAPAMLLVNLNSARPSGVELVRALRSGGITVPIVGLTQAGQADLKSAATALGVRSFMETPFDPSELHVRVAWAMGA